MQHSMKTIPLLLGTLALAGVSGTARAEPQKPAESAAPAGASSVVSRENLGDKSVVDVLKNELNLSMTDELVQAQVTQLVPVTTSVAQTQQILKSDELVFQPGSELVLNYEGKSDIIIVVKRLKLARNPSLPPQYTIRRAAPAVPDPPAKPSKTANGSSPTGYVNGKHGLPGGHGSTGTAGSVGRTRSIPSRLIIVVGSVEVQSGDDAPVKLQLVLPGANGGRGGDGGDGGNGGNGYSGLGGDNSRWRCRRQPGNGGAGGRGGTGGRGGAGGPAGPGMEVWIVGPKQALDALSFATFDLAPGQPGKGGGGGAGGGGGEGGRAGHRRGWCQDRADEGRNGDRGAAGAAGDSGAPASAGKVRMVQVNDIKALWPSSNP